MRTHDCVRVCTHCTGSSAIRDNAAAHPPSRPLALSLSSPSLEICLKVSCVRRWSLSWSVCLPLLPPSARLPAWQREKERQRKGESSHQEGTVGGEVPSVVLKVCIKGALRPTSCMGFLVSGRSEQGRLARPLGSAIIKAAGLVILRLLFPESESLLLLGQNHPRDSIPTWSCTNARMTSHVGLVRQQGGNICAIICEIEFPRSINKSSPIWQMPGTKESKC